jgi:hypothetical protein
MRLLFALLCASTPAILAGLAGAACTVAANVGDLGAAAPAETAAEGSASEPADGAAITDATTGGDALAPPADAGCGVDFAQEGTFVSVRSVIGAPPGYVGGTITAGTYVLTSLSYYAGGVDGTLETRETLVVRGLPPVGAFERLTESRKPTGSLKALPIHGESSTWRTPNAQFLFETPECPTEAFEITGQFTAQGTNLTLYDAENAVERVYRRVR